MAVKLGVSLYFLLISIVVSLLLSTQCEAAAAGGGKSLIETTCGKTQFPPICERTLESDPRSFEANLTGLSRIALEIATTQVNATTTVAFKLVTNATEYSSWAAREACFDYYNTSSHQLMDTALPSFDQRMYKTTSQAVDLASQSILHCNNLRVEELTATSTWLLQFTADIKTILGLL